MFHRVNTYGNRSVYILGEQNTLRLDDEEVDELFDVIRHTLKGGLLYGEVLARAELRRQALADGELSGELSGR